MKVFNNKGFSLTELLAALGIMSILIAIAIPEFSSLKGEMKAGEDLRKVIGAIQLVRREAIRMKATTRISFSSNSLSWDFYDDGTDEGSLTLSRNSTFMIIPADIVLNGLGLARGISGGELTVSVENLNQSSSFSINSNGYIAR